MLNFAAWRGDRPIIKTLVEVYAAGLQAEGKGPSTINQRLAGIVLAGLLGFVAGNRIRRS